MDAGLVWCPFSLSPIDDLCKEEHESWCLSFSCLFDNSWLCLWSFWSPLYNTFTFIFYRERACRSVKFFILPYAVACKIPENGVFSWVGGRNLCPAIQESDFEVCNGTVEEDVQLLQSDRSSCSIQVSSNLLDCLVHGGMIESLIWVSLSGLPVRLQTYSICMW